MKAQSLRMVVCGVVMCSIGDDLRENGVLADSF
jgi:hypothetical protein